jgi:flagella basal body P-ring formation protein FlgA
MRLLPLWLRLAALLALAVAPSAAEAPAPLVVTVILPLEARVDGTQIELGAIAEVRCENPQVAERVAATSLGYAPSPGYSRLLQNHEIGALLQQAHPQFSWIFQGQRATRVWPNTRLIAGAALADAALAALQRGAGARDVVFRLAAPVADLELPAGPLEPELSVEPQDNRIATGQLHVPVRIVYGGTPYRTVNTVFQVEVWQELPVAVREVLAGEVLVPSLFERRRVLLDQRVATPPLPIAALTGATAARNLRAGQPVTAGDVHHPVAVRAGDTVFVEVVKGAVSARVTGVLVASAALGERVLVRLTGSGREMLSTVISSELVQIQLGR